MIVPVGCMKKRHFYASGAFRSLLFPFVLFAQIIFIMAYSYVTTRERLTSEILSRRDALMRLTVSTIKERLDGYIGLGKSLSSRIRFRQLVAQGQWDDAIRIMDDVPRDFPFVERVFLSDIQGTLQSDTPALPNVRGRNFAHRDWYRGVSLDWRPYVSESYIRTADPRIYVIALAFPVRSDKGDVVGILVLQIPTDMILQWINEFAETPSNRIYFSDQKGEIIKSSTVIGDQKGVVDPRIPSRHFLLQAKREFKASIVQYDGEEGVLSFAVVTNYGWGVLSFEPLSSIFAYMNKTLFNLRLFYGVCLLIGLTLAGAVAIHAVRLKSAAQKIKDLNTQLTSRLRDLDSANKELEAFTYSVSHDLRAPLRAISGFSEILMQSQHERLDDKGRDNIGRIVAASARMSQLIEGLLRLSRITSKELQLVRINLSEMASKILSGFAALDLQRQVDIEIQGGLSAIGDSDLIQIALHNLLENAWKYTSKRAQARIEFGKASRDGQDVFFIRDNGIGFDMAAVSKLFVTFQRLHKASDFPGDGIGLAIVHRVITRHGGIVWAEGTIDVGATFYFTLPSPISN